MIPKVIHYCWFSGDNYPKIVRECLCSWQKVLLGYQFKLWTANELDLNCPFVKKAYEERKWAFVTDYMRLKILYNEGGIFLDTDVLMIKPFDDTLLQKKSFWNFACNGMVEPVVIGAQKGNTIIKSCLDYYLNLTEQDLNIYHYVEIPKIITPIFQQYGLKKYENKEQIIDDNVVLSHIAFCPMPFEKADSTNPKSYARECTYAIHLWNASWFDDEFRFFWNGRWGKGWHLVLQRLIKCPIQPIQYYKNLGYHLLRQIKLK